MIMPNARLRQRGKRFLTNPIRRRYLGYVRQAHTGPKVLANSIPKSGTFLLERCLSLLPDMVNYHQGVFLYGLKDMKRRLPALKQMGGGSYVQAHLGYSEEADEILRSLGWKHILIVRDPRDVVVSLVKFQMRHRDLPYYGYFHALADDQERYKAVIDGSYHRFSQNIGHLFSHYLNWQETDCLVVRFEDLVGELGGGDTEQQYNTVERVVEFIGFDLKNVGVGHVTSNLFDSQSRTFRKGVIGDWQNHLEQANLDLLYEIMGDLLPDLGYDFV